MKKQLTSNFIVLLTVFLLSNCRKKEDTSISKIYDYNVLIVPDLSNRINTEIHPKPLHDTVLINNIADNIENLLKVKNRQMNQLDIYKVDIINRGILNQNIADPQKLEINFRKFKNDQRESSDYKRDHLKADILLFKNNLSKLYAHSLQNSSGSDVWNYFNQTVSNALINQPDAQVAIGDNEYIIKGTKNIIILFTDGYIESVNNASGYALDQKSIKKIRDSYLKSGADNLEKFIQSKPEYHIKKTSVSLQNTSVIVFEMTDRSLDKNGASTIQPTDFEIMKILWSQWLVASGASKVEIFPAFSQKTEAYNALKRVMESL